MTLPEIPAFEDAALAARVDAHWNNLTKPPGSLGQLEHVVRRYALIRGAEPDACPRKAMYIFCADHGVVAEGVSPFPAAVTAQMVRNFLRGGAAINVLCRHHGIANHIVDCGVLTGPEAGVIDRRLAAGTANFTHEPAMTRAQAEQTLQNGIDLARAAAHEADILGIGEMGIGNTTSAAALLSVFAGLPPAHTAGRGAGLDDAGVSRKARCIEAALALHQPNAADPIGVLAAVGGFEIATMSGFLLGAAATRTPVMVDGFIASSAALAASALAPKVKEALLFAHRSAETAHHAMLQHLGARPILDLDLRLGEGSAAAIGIGLLETALQLYHGMATFADLV